MRCVRLCLVLLLTAFVCDPVAHAAVVVNGPMILRTIQEKNLCVITFDDGPSRHTPELLDILKERGIPATFFVVGSQVRYHPRLIQRIQAEGHEIGNHTASHVSLRHQPIDVQRAEIDSVQEALRRLGVVSRYIRPPYGRYDLNTIAIADQEGMGIVLWSVDSMDWMRKAHFDTLQPLGKNKKDRGVFLFHDTHAPTVASMPGILDRLIEGGCRFVTVSQFIEEVDGPMCPKTIQVENRPDQSTTPQAQSGDSAYPSRQPASMPANGSMGSHPVVSSPAVPAQPQVPDSDSLEDDDSDAASPQRGQSPTTALVPAQKSNKNKSASPDPV